MNNDLSIFFSRLEIEKFKRREKKNSRHWNENYRSMASIKSRILLNSEIRETPDRLIVAFIWKCTVMKWWNNGVHSKSISSECLYQSLTYENDCFCFTTHKHTQIQTLQLFCLNRVQLCLNSQNNMCNRNNASTQCSLAHKFSNKWKK